VKYYDKGAWAAHQGIPLPAGHHKLRYEVVCTRARPINALLNQTQVTLADLNTPGFYTAAAGELSKHWQLTVRRMPLDFTGLKLKDSTLLQSGASPEFWRGLKQAKVPQITIKRQKARYKELATVAQQRAGMDVYNQRFPVALAELVKLIPFSTLVIKWRYPQSKREKQPPPPIQPKACLLLYPPALTQRSRARQQRKTLPSAPPARAAARRAGGL
jgi:hypothetical protein